MLPAKFSLKPGIPKRYLMFVSGIVWGFASIMLIYKGYTNVHDFGVIYIIEIILIGITGGLIFYYLVFSNVTNRQTRRIFRMKPEKPCLFSFFNLRNYIVMSIMITTGILIGNAGIISGEALYTFYFIMGVPLFLSALKFLYFWTYYHELLHAFFESEKKSQEIQSEIIK